MGHWLMHYLGLDSGSGTAYLFWSGIGADAAELAIVGGLISIYRRHNCHVRGCWRIGRNQVEGTAFMVCRPHHPDGKPSHAHVLSAWREHQRRKNAGQ